MRAYSFQIDITVVEPESKIRWFKLNENSIGGLGAEQAIMICFFLIISITDLKF
jgi:hypothetical protein